MKKLLILMIVLGLYSNINTFGQCSTDLLFPVSIGMSKFQTINTLNLNENVYEVKDWLNYWSHLEYLSGDSVYTSEVYFKFKAHNCIKSNDNIVFLNFADNKLYKMTFAIWFQPKDFNKCLENYNQILESLKKEFPVYDEYISYNNTITKEQTGEGFWLYKNEEEKHYDKFEQIAIGYNIEYEMKWNEYSQEAFKTGNIEKYVLNISYVNCKDTKRDRRGY